MPTSGADSDNGRVTIALLAERIDVLTRQVGALTAEVKESNKCMNALALDGAKRETRLDTAEEEIVNLRVASNRNDLITGLAAAVAGAIAGIFGGRQ